MRTARLNELLLPGPLTAPEREALRDFARLYAVGRVGAALGVSRHMVLAAAAGLDIHPECAAKIRGGLERLAERRRRP